MMNIKAIYLISINIKAIISYFFKYLFIKLLLNIKIKLEIDFQIFLSFILSKFEYFFIKNLF